MLVEHGGELLVARAEPFLEVFECGGHVGLAQLEHVGNESRRAAAPFARDGMPRHDNWPTTRVGSGSRPAELRITVAPAPGRAVMRSAPVLGRAARW